MNNKSILITGGTGSFGNAFVAHVLKKYKPKKLIIFSRDELKQYEMLKKYPEKKYPNLRFFLGDVRDKERLLMALSGVDIVIHAAALKQVPAAEYNPIEAIKTNIIGAQNITTASIERKVKKVIALSTDKAANPINLYGATKLASDKLFVAANSLSGNKTKFSVVRYGNVLSSRGSVVPLFKELSKKKLPITITHKDMTRFWMTLDQSVKFVINCYNKMDHGEIFVPKLPSIKIIDLAKAINLKNKIKVIGLRDGEKIHEILCPSDSSHLTLELKDYYIICSNKERKNKLKKKFSCKEIPQYFEYNSKNNKNFLNVSEIKKLIK